MNRNMKRSAAEKALTRFPLLAILAIGVFLTGPAGIGGTHVYGATSQPTIRLFPTTVVENIKQTGDTARAMEEGLQDVVRELEQQMILYSQSKCEGSDGDPGCDEIVRQMGRKYLDMLNRMESQLPNMEQSVRITRDSMEKRIRQELGRKMTPRGLQQMLDGSVGPGAKGTGKIRSGKLSDKFRQYYKLVAMGSRTGTKGSLAAVASEIYLDSQDVLDLITLTRDEIGRSKLVIELNQIYGLVTPEMFKMVAGVKEVIFGESGDEEGIPGPPPGSIRQAYKSPLEM
ncbi:MAG: hypothetical protein JRK53_10805 [Deltaproteobacteria bacterium]|nr:hypothetical protein [Deltaproteobacteria bacterium]MBW2283745.1 hypothetical protein [Deltaproteobacteria bacterium]